MPSSPRPGRILIIEDHEPTRFLRRRLLRDAGYKVAEAANVTEALLLLETYRYDLILSDLNLPDGNGFALCRSVRQTDPSLPVILISSTYDDEAARQTALFSGACEFIADPVAPDVLIAAIQRHLG
jgi:DNA-binding response OmpR family regulator